MSSKAFNQDEFTKGKGRNDGQLSLSGPGIEVFLHGMEKPPTSLGHCLINVFRKYQDHILQVNAKTGEKFTYKEALDQAFALASGLKSRGITAGDSLGLVAHPTDPKINVILLASIFLGAILKPIDPQDKFFESKVNEHCKSGLRNWFCDKEKINDLISNTKEIGQIQIVSLDSENSSSTNELIEPFDTLLTQSGFEEAMKLSSQHIVLILSIEQNSQKIAFKNDALLKYSRRKSPNADDPGTGFILDYNDWSEGGEAWIIRRIFLFRSGGNCLVAVPPFDPEETLLLIQTHRISWLALKATQFIKMAQCSSIVAYDLSSLQVLNTPPSGSALYSLNEYLDVARERLPATRVLITGSTIATAIP
ncbi:uncharacterized protein LOC107265155 isoform X2 [Cephus cinctus]|nr:uncharacterized protein LOC107265155 isoform X2 [Cephus cinctus]XP_015589770.1 uncharacterized protein LOC107265155 isoform X2 [Cephus cinctus]XP_024938120.1 uncharacterized protein LOC107265155 isoform X2 [Cephus cinctus]